MTETPDPDKEEFRAGKDDIPDPVIERGEDGSLAYMSQELRQARWTVAKTRAAEKGTDPRTEFTAMIMERSRALKGPNPTQEKARKLYEWWQSGCGGVEPLLTQMTQDIRSWENLHPYEQARWAILAKALGNHPLSDTMTSDRVRCSNRRRNTPVSRRGSAGLTMTMPCIPKKPGIPTRLTARVSTSMTMTPPMKSG